MSYYPFLTPTRDVMKSRWQKLVWKRLFLSQMIVSLIDPNTFWDKEWWYWFSRMDEQRIWGAHLKICRTLRGWYYCQIQEKRISTRDFEISFQQSQKDYDETQTQEMHLWSFIWQILGLFGLGKMNWSQPSKNNGYSRHAEVESN